MKKLDPKSIWLFFIQYSIGLFFTIFFLILCSGGILFEAFQNNTTGASLGLLFVCLICLIPFILVLALSYLFAVLTYNNYKYELKEDGFYKESGIITKRYVSIPYERIQNIDIIRGLIPRALGLSDIQIQTAGMSMSYGGNAAMGANSEGRLPALSEQVATELRDELLKRAKGERKAQGL